MRTEAIQMESDGLVCMTIVHTLTVLSFSTFGGFSTIDWENIPDLPKYTNY